MKNNFMNRKVNGTNFILWTFLLYAVCSIGTADGCPARCSCGGDQCKDVDCFFKNLGNIPTGIPNDTCSL